MGSPSEIKSLIRSIANPSASGTAIFEAQVISASDTSCSISYQGIRHSDVRLVAGMSGSTSTIIAKPAVGSSVLVADLSAGKFRDMVVILTETISKSIRHRNFSRTMDYLTNFDKWMGNATFIRIEPGIHHDCEFIVYEASWDGKTIEFKVMVTNVGNLVYTMRIK